MLIECQNCGAPLDVSPGRQLVECRYCGQKSRLQAARAIAQQTPRGWTPPPVWTPPPQFPQRSEPIRYHPPRRKTGSSIAILVAFALVVGGIVVYATQGSEGAGWNGRSKLICGTDDEIVIEDKKGSRKGTLIEAKKGCKLTIKSCRLKGNPVIEAGAGAEIVIEGSVLESSKKIAVEAAAAAHIRISAESTIKGQQAAIRAGQGAELTINDSRVESPGTAIEGGQGAKVRATKAAIHGGRHSFELESGGQLRLTDIKETGARKLGFGVKVDER